MKYSDLFFNINVGKTLKEIRENKGIKQKEIIDALPYPCHLSKIENNHVAVSFNPILDILNYLNVSIDEFIEIGSSNQATIVQRTNETMYKKLHTITRPEILKIIKELEEHIDVGVDQSQLQAIKLIHAKLQCFYSLNFEENEDDAQEYFQLILDYLFAKIFNYTVFDIELSIIAFAKCSFAEAAVLARKAEHVFTNSHSLKHAELESRFLLAYTKNLFQQEKLDLLPTALIKVEQQMSTYASANFRSEFLLLKGYYFLLAATQEQQTSDEAIDFLHRGLQLAKENNEVLLYTKWSKLIHKTYNL